MRNALIAVVGLSLLASCGGKKSGQDALPSRDDKWVSSIVLSPDSNVTYVGKTRSLGVTTVSDVKNLSGLRRISIGDTVKGIRIGAIKCTFYTKDSSYGGEQFMWRGRWAVMAGRSKHEIQNAVQEDGSKRYDYIHIAPVTLDD